MNEQVLIRGDYSHLKEKAQKLRLMGILLPPTGFLFLLLMMA